MMFIVCCIRFLISEEAPHAPRSRRRRLAVSGACWHVVCDRSGDEEADKKEEADAYLHTCVWQDDVMCARSDAPVGLAN